MNAMQETLRRQEASARALQEEHSDRLKQQETMAAARLEAEAQRSGQLVRDLEEARTRFQCAEECIKRQEEELRDLRDQLQVARLPSPETDAELRTLRTRVTTLEAAEMKSTLRAKTIDARYRVGDLVRCDTLSRCHCVTHHIQERRGEGLCEYLDPHVTSHP